MFVYTQSVVIKSFIQIAPGAFNVVLHPKHTETHGRNLFEYMLEI